MSGPARGGAAVFVLLAACGRLGFSAAEDGGVLDRRIAPRDGLPDSADAPDDGAVVEGGPDGDASPDGTAEATHGATAWAYVFGGPGAESGAATAVDRSGNVLVAGQHGDGVDFGDGPRSAPGAPDLHVVCRGSDGSPRWVRAFGGVGAESAQGLGVDGDANVYVAGHVSGVVDFGGGPLPHLGSADAFVLSLADDGSFRWARSFGGAGFDRALGLAVGDDGVVVAGLFEGAMDVGGVPLVGAGAFDAFVVKLAADGRILWARAFGGVGEDHGQGVAFDVHGHVLLAGRYSGDVDFGAGVVEGRGGFDAFVVSLDSAGVVRWSRGFGGSGWDAGYGVGSNSAGDVFVTGYHSGASDFGGHALPGQGASDLFVMGLAATGDVRWVRSVGGPGNEVGMALAVDALGDLHVGGIFGGPLDLGDGPIGGGGGSDAFVMSLDPRDGATRWARGYGGALNDGALGLSARPMGGLAVAGAVTLGADLGLGAVSVAGGSDAFLLLLE